MAILANNVLSPRGRMKKDGITYYVRNGQTVVRSSTSEQPHRRTRQQFIARQRLANNAVLWKVLLRATKPVLAGGKTSYGRFNTLMRKSPVVFLTKYERMMRASLLVPGMPVSDGMLPDIDYRLGEVEGRPALLTSLRLAKNRTTLIGSLFGRGADLKYDDRLVLFRLRQIENEDSNIPKVRASVEPLTYDDLNVEQPFSDIELQEVDGCLALVGDLFADDSMGWALVHMDGEGKRASTQCVVTRCTFYEQYTTEEALARAAESYGGLTEASYLRPEIEDAD